MTAASPAGRTGGWGQSWRAAAGAGAILWGIAGAGAEPYLPDRDEIVLERLPTADDPRVREARRLAGLLDRQRPEPGPALEVARRYIDLGRSEADPRYFGLAEGVLKPWLGLPDPPPAILLERSTLRRARHDFDGALRDLERILSIRPNDLQAQLDRAALLEALGDYPRAEQACLHVLRLHPSLVGLACVASTRSLAGQARASYEALAQGLGATPEDEPGRRWALTILAEVAARLGEPEAAERHFRQAIALGPKDVYLLAAYADLLLDRNRPEEVLVLLEGETRADGLLLRQAIAARRLSDPRAAGWRDTLDARFAALKARGAATHLREEARFALEVADQPELALDLAVRNWARQKGPADARPLLQAALAACRPAAAGPALAWLERTGTEDVALDRLRRALSGLAS